MKHDCLSVAPVITNETTDSIEELIKQRIRDKAFDDVERKKKAPHGDEAQAYKKEIVLEHEKSQLSLAQVYEQEYLKKQTVGGRSCKELDRRAFY